ncbi:hypothetical protein LZ32DRAFT_222014 [Colletotrichum eremochloae]|nr:hypothetical protein LZ32DRAFT_222014 [Colletotrichum eremochloae]
MQPPPPKPNSPDTVSSPSKCLTKINNHNIPSTLVGMYLCTSLRLTPLSSIQECAVMTPQTPATSQRHRTYLVSPCVSLSLQRPRFPFRIGKITRRQRQRRCTENTGPPSSLPSCLKHCCYSGLLRTSSVSASAVGNLNITVVFATLRAPGSPSLTEANPKGGPDRT